MKINRDDREGIQRDQLMDDLLPSARAYFEFGQDLFFENNSFAMSQPKETIRFRPYAVSRPKPVIETDRNSPEYLSTCRRHRCRNLAKILSRAQVENDALFITDLAIFRRDVIKLIDFLFRGDRKLDNPTEGNTCEVLRSLRDSSAKNGWKRFQQRETLETVIKVLTRLADIVEVSAIESRQLIKLLEGTGLKTIDDCLLDIWLSEEPNDELDANE